ncbi:tetratricopeptide repeat protein [Streptomyces sp. NPDC048479]|uniref:tetratricopeptide repeat protein n=1 Tax=Streptomyces sp. NPDC048479 TaxID=3154725 RepID=UPI00343FC8D5
MRARRPAHPAPWTGCAGHARTRRSLAFPANGKGRHGETLDHYQQALALYRPSEDVSGQASVLNEIGWTHILRCRYEHALACYGRALAIYQNISDHYLEADTLAHIGDARDAQGDRSSADDVWRRAVGILNELGHPDADDLARKIEVAAAGIPTSEPG